jgi:Flp pilus assembly protein TadD
LLHAIRDANDEIQTMSIVTDALNRVQAERARPSGSSESSGGTESARSPASPKPNLFTPQSPSKTIRNILRWSLIIVGVVAVGIGAYLWGLTLMPDVARVSPDHDVIPEVVSEPAPKEEVSSQVAEVLPVPALEGQSSEAVSPVLKEVTGSERASPGISSGLGQNAKASNSPRSREEQVAMVKEGPPKVLENSRISVGPSEQGSQTKESPQNTETVLLESPEDLSSSEALSPTTNSDTKSSKPSRSAVPPQVRKATPTEATLIQAKYLIQKRRYSHAMTILKPLFVTPPDTWEPWFWLGTAHLGLEQFEQAEEAFLEGLSRNAAIPHLWVQRALVSQQRGLYGEAVEALRQAEMIAPDLPEVQLNLAYSLEAQGQIGVAVQHYQTFLAMTEGRPSYQAARKKVLERILRLEVA